MPYYIFKINPDQTTEYLDEAEKYKDAREKVRELRIAHVEDDGTVYRMVFAKTVGQGETLIAPGHREERIIGDD
jgi:ribosomal protein S4